MLKYLILLLGIFSVTWFTCKILLEKERRAIISENRCIYLDSIKTNNAREMAFIISAECMQCDYFEKMLVASVIMNRVRDSDYPKTIGEVIREGNAFHGYKSNQYIFSEESYNAAYQTLSEGPIDSNILFFYRNTLKKPRFVKSVLYREKFHNFGI